jgi:chaperone modulatory protein CbpM
MVKLRDSFGLNPPGMALALTYLEKIEALEHRLRELECLLPR